MRFSTIATTLFLGGLASAQDAYPAAGDNTMVAIWTLTKTVERVVQTVTATRGVNTTVPTVSPPLATASLGIYPQSSNGTSIVNGTGTPSGGMPTGIPVSGADRVSLEMLSLMAVAGLVGLARL